MSEFDWIAKYFAPLAKGEGAAGLKDDVATLSDGNRIVTVDAVVQGVHFLSSDSIDTVARKLVRVNVSDVIAKGARPAEALLTLGWPKERSESDLERFARAFGKELKQWGISLLGGDTVISPSGLFLSLTLTGRLPANRPPILRSGAQAGDTVWISGEIGWGRAGLIAAQNGQENTAVQRYRVPEVPPLDIAEIVLEHAHASMDISDGLIADLQKLLKASDCGAVLHLDAVLIAPDLAGDPLEAALAACTVGDDYQCLFTALADRQEAIASFQGAKLTPIGSITEGEGLDLRWKGRSVPIPKNTGYEHG
ncbi:MAG: thiamine-phosphate kinase [Pseudomonadota bacterium]